MIGKIMEEWTLEQEIWVIHEHPELLLCGICKGATVLDDGVNSWNCPACHGKMNDGKISTGKKIHAIHPGKITGWMFTCIGSEEFGGEPAYGIQVDTESLGLHEDGITELCGYMKLVDLDRIFATEAEAIVALREINKEKEQ